MTRELTELGQEEGHARQDDDRGEGGCLLPYVEGADDERSALSAANEIVLRYIAVVQDEGWEPFASAGRGPKDAG
jgi:hypothetical protein